MALKVLFDLPHMSQAQYDGVIRDLAAAGLAAPTGRLYHVASPRGQGWHVLDVWESEATLSAFAGSLMPLLAKHGVEPPTPEVLPVHNIIPG